MRRAAHQHNLLRREGKGKIALGGDDGDRACPLTQRPLGYRPFIEKDIALLEPQDSAHQTQQSRFARAVRPDESHKFAVPDGKRHLRERRLGSVSVGHLRHIDLQNISPFLRCSR